jgi:hypothetical protein
MSVNSGPYFASPSNLALNLDATNSRSNVGIGTTNTLIISAGNNASPTGLYNWYANQNISCVRMYNSVLTANQIAQNFNALRSRFGI